MKKVFVVEDDKISSGLIRHGLRDRFLVVQAFTKDASLSKSAEVR